MSDTQLVEGFLKSKFDIQLRKNILKDEKIFYDLAFFYLRNQFKENKILSFEKDNKGLVEFLKNRAEYDVIPSKIPINKIEAFLWIFSFLD